MRRKSVRGCIVGADLHALNVALIDFNNKTIEGLTDAKKPNTALPKRASKLRRLFGIPAKKVSKEQQHVVVSLLHDVSKEHTSASGKKYVKCQKI